MHVMSKVGSQEKGNAWTNIAVRQTCEKYLAISTNVYWDFKNLEKNKSTLRATGYTLC